MIRYSCTIITESTITGPEEREAETLNHGAQYEISIGSELFPDLEAVYTSPEVVVLRATSVVGLPGKIISTCICALLPND